MAERTHGGFGLFGKSDQSRLSGLRRDELEAKREAGGREATGEGDGWEAGEIGGAVEAEE